MTDPLDIPDQKLNDLLSESASEEDLKEDQDILPLLNLNPNLLNKYQSKESEHYSTSPESKTKSSQTIQLYDDLETRIHEFLDTLNIIQTDYQDKIDSYY